MTSDHSSDRAKKAKEETRCFESTLKAEGTPKHSYTSKKMASEKMTVLLDWIVTVMRDPFLHGILGKLR